jgi:enoyl-CoA hydratase/carnithine racemase
MMSDNELQCSVQDRVAVITINRPPLNVMPAAVYHRLCDMVVGLVEKKEARAVIITGTGKVFISGLDINDINGLKNGEENTRMTMDMKNAFRRVEKLARPVIACINGYCFGGGLELSLACHIRLAATEAKLGLPEVSRGVLPSFGGTQRLARLIGKAKALELMLTGRSVLGEEASRLGIVNAAYPSAELLDKAKELAGQIAEMNPQAVEATMHATMEGLEMDVDKGMAHESVWSSKLIGTFNAKEGMTAFFERRKPVFRDE